MVKPRQSPAQEELTLARESAARQRQSASAATLVDARATQIDSKAKGAQYAKHIASHLAHGALGRVIIQRERYVAWASTLLHGLQSKELHAAASAVGVPGAADGAPASESDSTCALLTAKREELLAVLGYQFLWLFSRPELEEEHWFSRQVGRLDLRSFEMGQVESVAFTDDQELMIISEPGARFLVRWKLRKSEAEPN